MQLSVEELSAIYSLLTRPGLKIDVSEIEGINTLKNRIGAIIREAIAAKEKKASEAVDSEKPKKESKATESK